MSVPRTTADTRLLCLLGHPVGHSLSPQLHSAAIAATGLDAVYLAFDVAPANLPEVVRSLRGMNFLGANLTIPHKHAALALGDLATEEAVFIGAGNTLYLDEEGRLCVDNTDAAGLLDVLQGCEVQEGDPALIVGAGGAARAAAVALGRLGAAVDVRARRADAAADVADLARRAGGVAPTGARPRIVVNATPLGRHGERLDADLMGLGEGRIALDLNYGTPSPFLREAAAAGGRAEDGLGMLVGQAEAAFARWTGARPPAGVMRDALT